MKSIIRMSRVTNMYTLLDSLRTEDKICFMENLVKDHQSCILQYLLTSPLKVLFLLALSSTKCVPRSTKTTACLRERDTASTDRSQSAPRPMLDSPIP